MIVLSYLGILAIIPLVAEKEDREVQWHAKHGLVLFGAFLVLWIGTAIIGAVMSTVTGGLDFGCSGCALTSIVSIAYLVIVVVAIVKGVNGERFRIPGISDLADKF